MAEFSGVLAIRGSRRLPAIVAALGSTLGALLAPAAAGAEDGLAVDFSHRTRFEGLHNQFRPGLGSSDHGVAPTPTPTTSSQSSQHSNY